MNSPTILDEAEAWLDRQPLSPPIIPTFERELCQFIIGRALHPLWDGELHPVRTTLKMHTWLTDAGMAPGDFGGEPGYCIWDRDACLRAVGAVPLPPAQG